MILDLNLPVARRHRGLPADPRPAGHGGAADHHADGPHGRVGPRVRASTWAPTTTSPSRSACASWPRASAPCSGASRARAPRRCRSTAASTWSRTSTPSSVTVDGEPIRLTRREFELLKCLVENRNRVLSRDRLLERVWGYEQFIETRSVDVHVGRLRSKLGPAGAADRDRRRTRLSVRRVDRASDRRRRARRSSNSLHRALDAMPVACSSTSPDDLAVALLPDVPPGVAARDGHALGLAGLHDVRGSSSSRSF